MHPGIRRRTAFRRRPRGRWQSARERRASAPAVPSVLVTAFVLAIVVAVPALPLPASAASVTTVNRWTIRGGVDTGFASLAAVGTAALVLRRADGGMWWALDGLAPAAVAGLAGWHAACLPRAACLGSVTDLPWGIAQEGSVLPRHPVELYAALLLMAVAITLVARKRRRPPAGVVAGIALAAAALVRMITEPMRLAVGTRPIVWYTAGVVMGVAVAMWRARYGTPTPPA